MRPEPRKRIAVSGPQAPLGGLDAAFGDVQMPDLPEAKADAPTSGPLPVWKKGRVVLRKETAHRGGKIVIVIDGFATHLPLSVIEKTAKKVRTACGCGGTVKERRVEIQGDQIPKIRAVLEAEGFEVRGER